MVLIFGVALAQQTGDLVFHESTSSQAAFLKLATGSRYTHVGVVVVEDGQRWVYEAVQPVQRTRYDAWVDRGVDDHVVLLRPKTALTDDQQATLTAYVTSQLGKDYDALFAWTDDTMYCSELVYKAYAEAGVTLVPLRTFGDYDLSDPQVQQLIAARWGPRFDEDAEVVGPADLMESPYLERL